MKALPVFELLRSLRAFEKRNLQFLRTVEDFDLVREIGYHQERGRPLTVKQLYLLDLASMATVQRRLRRLRQAGAIQQVRSGEDGRSMELRLTPKAAKAFERYAELLVDQVRVVDSDQGESQLAA